MVIVVSFSFFASFIHRIMEMYFFRHGDFQHYYNCSAKSDQEWSELGQHNVGIGITCIVIGLITLPLYIPCMTTMLRSELWQHSCYKLMFFNGVIDIIGIVNSCFITGYFAIQGTVFCHAPHFNYLYGCLIMGFWTVQCMTSVVLAFNRCVNFWNSSLLSSMFQGNRTYYWYLLPIVYFLYFCIFVPPCLYSSYVHMWVLDPFLGVDVDVDPALVRSVTKPVIQVV
uniref:G_PROTEIN_RECEP_F1_2 domain-containing protein n=1 Tax=Steinernema glaseri TaxID=37863 RepID=A0A1I7ZZP1_9BILA